MEKLLLAQNRTEFDYFAFHKRAIGERNHRVCGGGTYANARTQEQVHHSPDAAEHVAEKRPLRLMLSVWLSGIVRGYVTVQSLYPVRHVILATGILRDSLTPGVWKKLLDPLRCSSVLLYLFSKHFARLVIFSASIVRL